MDDTFEFLTKIYSELTEFRKETNVKFDKVDSRLNKIEITLEHDVKNSLQSLHEGMADHTSKLNEHSERLTAIENKVDYIALAVTSQDKRLKVVETSKKRAK